MPGQTQAGDRLLRYRISAARKHCFPRSTSHLFSSGGPGIESRTRSDERGREGIRNTPCPSNADLYLRLKDRADGEDVYATTHR